MMSARQAMIRLNVGGQLYNLTVDSVKQSDFLHTICTTDVPVKKDDAGYIIIDRDSIMFSHILKYMRNNDYFQTMDESLVSDFVEEAGFYCIELPLRDPLYKARRFIEDTEPIKRRYMPKQAVMVHVPPNVKMEGLLLCSLCGIDLGITYVCYKGAFRRGVSAGPTDICLNIHEVLYNDTYWQWDPATLQVVDEPRPFALVWMRNWPINKSNIKMLNFHAKYVCLIPTEVIKPMNAYNTDVSNRIIQLCKLIPTVNVIEVELAMPRSRSSDSAYHIERTIHDLTCRLKRETCRDIAVKCLDLAQ